MDNVYRRVILVTGMKSSNVETTLHCTRDYDVEVAGRWFDAVLACLCDRGGFFIMAPQNRRQPRDRISHMGDLMLLSNNCGIDMNGIQSLVGRCVKLILRRCRAASNKR